MQSLRLKFTIIFIAIILIIAIWKPVFSAASEVNIIPNHQVEEGNNNQPTHWKKFGEARCSWDSTVYHSASHSLKIQGPGQGEWQIQVPVKPGKLYKPSFYFKAKTTKENNPNVSVYAWVQKVGGKGEPNVLYATDWLLKNQPEWIKIELGDYISPEGVSHLILHLSLNTIRSVDNKTQGDESAIWFDDIIMLEAEPQSTAGHGYLITRGGDYALWGESGSQKVYQDDSVPQNNTQKDEVHIQCAKNESEPFQLIINPDSDWRQVSWKWTDFVGPTTIPKERLKYFRVEYLYFEQKYPNNTYRRDGLTPDPLPVEKQSDLHPRVNNPFWFLIEVPSHIPGGIYTSQLTLERKGIKIITIPIKLEVWNFSLPKKPSIDINSGISYNSIFLYETGDKFEIAKRYYRNYAEHRTTIRPMADIGVHITRNLDGKKIVKTDTAEFEKHIGYMKSIGLGDNIHLGSEVLKLIENKYFTGEARIPVFTDDTKANFNLEFVELFSQYISQIMTALKRQGCYNHPRIKIFDEPNVTNQTTINLFVNIAKLLKQIDSNIYLFSSGRFHKDFQKYYDRWEFPFGILQFSKQDMALAGLEGKHIYNNSIPKRILPLLRVRLFHWGLWQEKFTGGNNWWDTTQWFMINRQANPSLIRHDPWTKAFRDDGVLLYPPRPGRHEVGPINSLRWEMMRQGLEDYEYLVLLEKLIKTQQGKTSPEIIASAQKALARAKEVCSRTPYIIGDNDHPYTLDTTLVEKVRRDIAINIEKLSRIK
jgi:hypothetical protein